MRVNVCSGLRSACGQSHSLTRSARTSAMAASGAAAPVPSVVDEALATIAAEEGFREPRFHVELGSTAGDGFSSVLYRAIIRDENTTEGISQELSVMCKTTLTETSSPFIAAVFAVESHMYKRVLPAMEDVVPFEKPLPWPRCYHASLEGPAPCLVVADLRPGGFVTPRRSAPLDRQHCRLALAQLARLHGAGMALQHRRPDAFQDMRDAFQRPMDLADFQAKFDQFAPMLAMVPEMLKARFPEGSEGNIKLKKFFSNENYHTAMTTTLFSSEAAPSYAIIHGDCHLNNMMFQYDERGAVTGCRLIDFQMSRYGCPALDLTTLLLVCTAKATRDAHWDALLRGYHAEVHATLRAAGVADPDAVVSWEALTEQVRTTMPFGLAVAPLLLQAFYADAEEAEKLRDAFQDMNNSDDLSKMKEAMTAMPSQPNPEMVQRLADIAQTLLDWGWL